MSDDEYNSSQIKHLIRRMDEKGVVLTMEEVEMLPLRYKREYYGPHSLDLNIAEIKERIDHGLPLNEEEQYFWNEIGYPTFEETELRAHKENLEKVQDTFKNLSGWKPLPSAERKLLKKLESRTSQKFKAKKQKTVLVDSVDILDDVVKGRYRYKNY